MPQTITGGTRDYTADSGLIVRDVSDILSKIHPQENSFITLLMKTSTETGPNMKFEHLEDDWVGNSTSSTANLTNETTLNVTTGDGVKFVARDIIMNPTTGENMLVTAVSTDALTITRAYGSVATAAILTTDVLYRIGSAAYEGAGLRAAVTSTPDFLFNYCQDFQDTVDLTDIDAAQKKYGPKTREYLQAKMMVEHKIRMNASFWFGQKKLDTTASRITRTCAGIYREGITTNVKNLGGQPLTDKAIFDFVAMVRDFSDCTNLWMFASTNFLIQLSLLQMRLVRLEQSSEEYGLTVQKLRVLGTTVKLVEEKSFAYHGYPNLAVLVDMNNVKMHKFVGDGLNGNTSLTMDVKSLKNGGYHGHVDEVRTIAAPRIRNEKSHAVMTGWAA